MAFIRETVQSLRNRFRGHIAGMENPFANNKCKIFNKHFGVGFCRNASYIVNIIDKLSGLGKDDNCIPIPA